MRVLFVSKTDWANVGYLFAQGLKQVGIPATSLSLRPVKMGYPKGSKIVTEDVMKARAKYADAVVWLHSEHIKLPTKGKRKLVFHGGSRYRNKTKEVLKIFNPIVDVSLVQTGELLDRGAKNEVWLLPGVDTDFIRPAFGVHEKLVVAHYPRNSARDVDVKGTLVINRMMGKFVRHFPNRVLYKSAGRPKYRPLVWEKNLKRMAGCDIYVESMSRASSSGNKHDWSMTALEAAALGKIVVTNFLFKDRYLREYGSCPLMVANNRHEFSRTMHVLLNSSKKELETVQKETRRWVEEKHSLKAVGERLKKAIYEGG